MIFLVLTDGIGTEIIAALLILTVGWLWGRWRSSLAWRKKEFRNRIVLALNHTEQQGDKTALKLRTLFERNIQDVFHNSTMIEVVNKAINEVNDEDPLLPLPKEDSWYVLNAILNQIAEQFARGTLAKNMGCPVTSKWYLFCLTFEKDGGIRMHKLRIMLIQKEALLNFPDSGDIELESEKHKLRIETLRKMKKEFTQRPHLFMDMEICI